MCGRFSLFVPPDALAERFSAEPVRPIEARYNIAPGDEIATITNVRPDEIDVFRWGLVPSWADDEWTPQINARAETIDEKPAFRDAFADRRCLVLADGFYEWQSGRGSNQPYRIERADGAPFAFAGLWEDGGGSSTVAIVTTEANGVVAPVHDRMPVMLAPGEEQRWLTAEDGSEQLALLDSFPAAETEAYPVSTAVNDPGNDSPAVIEPVEVDEQSGLDEFR